jgi:hypothetical protein
MLVIPAIWEVKIGGSVLRPAQAKELTRPYLKEQVKHGGAVCNPIMEETKVGVAQSEA